MTGKIRFGGEEPQDDAEKRLWEIAEEIIRNESNAKWKQNRLPKLMKELGGLKHKVSRSTLIEFQQLMDGEIEMVLATESIDYEDLQEIVEQ